LLFEINTIDYERQSLRSLQVVCLSFSAQQWDYPANRFSYRFRSRARSIRDLFKTILVLLWIWYFSRNSANDCVCFLSKIESLWAFRLHFKCIPWSCQIDYLFLTGKLRNAHRLSQLGCIPHSLCRISHCPLPSLLNQALLAQIHLEYYYYLSDVVCNHEQIHFLQIIIIIIIIIHYVCCDFQNNSISQEQHKVCKDLHHPHRLHYCQQHVYVKLMQLYYFSHL